LEGREIEKSLLAFLESYANEITILPSKCPFLSFSLKEIRCTLDLVIKVLSRYARPVLALSTMKLKNIDRILLWSLGKNHDAILIADRDLSF